MLSATPRPSSFMTALFTLLVLAAFGASVKAQDWARNDGSIPMALDWSHKHVIYTGGYTPEQFQKMMKDPRAFASLLRRGDPNVEALARGSDDPSIRSNREANEYMREHDGSEWRRHRRGHRDGSDHTPNSPGLQRDWAVSLGTTGGVAAGMTPAKYNFDINNAPSCANDFAVFPVNASNTNVRAHLVGTFTGLTVGSTSITITPAGKTGVTITLAPGASNTTTTFVASAIVATEAANLATAINLNLSANALDELAAVASGGTVTVYALTAGVGSVLTDTSSLTNFGTGWAITAGTSNNTQANIVGLNQLYSGATSPLCLADPEFIFSYASGVGPVATSPSLSLDGTKIAYVENDPNIGAIFHVLTIASPGTEHGTCTNTGAAAPTCATAPVIPGSTAGSTAVDYMVPLGLFRTAAAGASDSYSSPFIRYDKDIAYVGDDGGYLYAISPAFNGSKPAQSITGFPATVSANKLSGPSVDVSGTGNIFVGDSGGFLYNYSSAGALEGTKLTAGTGTNGVRDAPMIDSTNAVGYVVACNNATPSVAQITQFPFTGTGFGTTTVAALNYTGDDEYGCGVPVAQYDPTPNNQYFIGGPTATNAAITACFATHYPGVAGFGASWYNGLETFTFASGAIHTPFFGFAYNITTGASACSPLMEFYGTPGAASITGVTQSGTTVTVTANNSFVPNDSATISGITAGAGTCNSTAATDIGGTHLIVTANATSFTFTSLDNVNINGGGTNHCTISGTAAATPQPSYAVTGIAQSGTTVSVTLGANAFVAGQTIVLSNIAANGANCTATDIAWLNGERTVLAAGNPLTFTAPVSTTVSGCTLTGATAAGPTADYLFLATSVPAEAYTFTLPMPTGTQTDWTGDLAENATDATGGTSGMTVDNDSLSGQAASIYFGTLATSNTCGTGVYCAIKLTQSGLN